MAASSVKCEVNVFTEYTYMGTMACTAVSSIERHFYIFEFTSHCKYKVYTYL